MCEHASDIDHHFPTVWKKKNMSEVNLMAEQIQIVKEEFRCVI